MIVRLKDNGDVDLAETLQFPAGYVIFESSIVEDIAQNYVIGFNLNFFSYGFFFKILFLSKIDGTGFQIWNKYYNYIDTFANLSIGQPSVFNIQNRKAAIF